MEMEKLEVSSVFLCLLLVAALSAAALMLEQQ